MRAVSSLVSSSGAIEVAARPIFAFRVEHAGGIEGSRTFRVSWAVPERTNKVAAHPTAIAFISITDYHLRVPSSGPSVSLRFRDVDGPVIALPCAQGVAQQFLNFSQPLERMEAQSLDH